MLSAMNPEYNNSSTANAPHTVLQPPHGSLIPTSPGCLPTFHFPHPLMPYDLANIRTVGNGRPLLLPQNNSTSSVPSSDNLSSSRLSPASSRPSSSSPPSSAHSISMKMNSSIEIGSNHEHSEEDSDDEPIDVVKSAFVPILRPPPSNPIISIPDSTVQDKPIEPARQRCELKAPSTRKPKHYQTVGTGPRSPTETKIKSATQKQVWRPY